MGGSERRNGLSREKLTSGTITIDRDQTHLVSLPSVPPASFYLWHYKEVPFRPDLT